MATTYQGIDKIKKNNLMVLKGKFERCSMEKSESIDSYFSRLLALRSDMELNGHSIEDEVIVEKVLHTLPSQFNYLVAVLQETKDISTMSVKELHGSLLLHEERVNEQMNESEMETPKKAL